MHVYSDRQEGNANAKMPFHRRFIWRLYSIADAVDSDMSMSRGEGNSAAVPEEGVTDLLRWLHSCNLDLFNQPQVP